MPNRTHMTGGAHIFSLLLFSFLHFPCTVSVLPCWRQRCSERGPSEGPATFPEQHERRWGEGMASLSSGHRRAWVACGAACWAEPWGRSRAWSRRALERGRHRETCRSELGRAVQGEELNRGELGCTGWGGELGRGKLWHVEESSGENVGDDPYSFRPPWSKGSCRGSAGVCFLALTGLSRGSAGHALKRHL